jgi:hypothetical protein
MEAHPRNLHGAAAGNENERGKEWDAGGDSSNAYVKEAAGLTDSWREAPRVLERVRCVRHFGGKVWVVSFAWVVVRMDQLPLRICVGRSGACPGKIMIVIRAPSGNKRTIFRVENRVPLIRPRAFRRQVLLS